MAAKERIELGCGFGSIPDVTGDPNTLSFDGKRYLDPNALGEYVAAVVNFQGMKLVVGSLGFGGSAFFDGIWWALGSATAATAKDFGKRFHTWAEDGDGNVYDIVPKEWHELAMRNRTVILVGDPDRAELIRGQSKENLSLQGLRYIPAPPDTQSVLHTIAQRAFGPVLALLAAKGWEGTGFPHTPS